MQKLRGLYAITMASPQIVTQVAAAIAGGACVIQYRDKSQDQQGRLAEAQAIRALCVQAKIPFLINDDLDLALAVQADGIHLGKEDLSLSTARQQLGTQAIIGISCYDQLERAYQAQEQGADYVAFGRFFPSQSKPNAVQARLDLLTQAKQQINLPIVAIGGITPENGASLVQAGADMLAVIQGVFAQPDVRQAAMAYQALFSS